VPISIFCNFIRVTITSVLQVYGYRSLATGGAHTVLGLGMMVLALLLFGVVNWALSAIVTEGDGPVEPDGGRA
jgi:exosortase/archaeosortase family protein